MASLRTSLEESLKRYPGLHKIGSGAYRFLRRTKDSLMRLYIRFFELLLPKSFFIQSTPDFVVDTYFSDFFKENRRYSRNTRTIVRDGTRLLSLKLLLDLVIDLPEGEYAELGTYRGNFAKLIYQFKHKSSTFYCFDTFEGFANSDVESESDRTGVKTKSGHFSDTSLDLVRKNITGSTGGENLELIQGFFPDTFEGMEDKKWRFVHLDADLYEPMKAGVEKFWPNIVEGGLLLIHDYNGAYVGTKKAIDEYFLPLGIVPMPLPDKVGSAFVFKPKS